MEKNQIIDWLENQKKVFKAYLEDMRKHKARALNPINQGRIMASAGIVTFIDEEIKFIDNLGKEISQ